LKQISAIVASGTGHFLGPILMNFDTSANCLA
jgi:hypothetical protein